MAKIMLVEDDNNLRDIYAARLQAEGYEIVSAKDGEEALALAVQEKPDLIISDVMMPKISGFDMLDILRTTPETKNTKVIMMTALSQSEDQQRATKLGADKYLIKSQVTLEDVVATVGSVLNGTDTQITSPTSPAPVAETPVSSPAQAPVTQPTPAPVHEAEKPEPTTHEPVHTEAQPSVQHIEVAQAPSGVSTAIVTPNVPAPNHEQIAPAPITQPTPAPVHEAEKPEPTTPAPQATPSQSSQLGGGISPHDISL